MMEFIEGSTLSGVVLELVRDQKKGASSRPRVKPIHDFLKELNVEFSTKLREQNPIGSRFVADVKICQKHQDGKKKGPPYLRAYENTIFLINDYNSPTNMKAIKKEGTKSNRVYTYINMNSNESLYE
ncbi:MAG: hypothetical protein JWM96_595, partial [Alphaproteobacteria bacterium]|nr:hypothetical protein [Alphaproteobacteria bacterium]